MILSEKPKFENALPSWRFIHTHFGFGYRLAAESTRRSQLDNTAATTE